MNIYWVVEQPTANDQRRMTFDVWRSEGSKKRFLP